MSVEVKTPTRNQFEHTEFPCGEKLGSESDQTLSSDIISFTHVKNENITFQHQHESGPSMLSLGLSSDTSSIRFDTHKSDDQKYMPMGTRKRRASMYSKETASHMPFGFRRKRLKSAADQIVLPTKFLLGGNINDPLNLNSMNNEEVNKLLNAKTPISSPLPTPAHRQNVEVQIPTNISDPLNLNCVDDDGNIVKSSNKKKKRHSKYKKKADDSTSSITGQSSKESEKRKGLMEALKIDIEEEFDEDSDNDSKLDPTTSSDVDITMSIKATDTSKIVSPVIPQTSPGSRYRRHRAMSVSDSKPEASSSISRAILITSSPPALEESHKTTPPKRFFKKGHFQKNSLQNYCKNPKFIYGNYNRYYGYRNPELEDHRLRSFRGEWFDGKDVLDIGCNVGHLTLAIAREMNPRRVIGIDIDSALISAARKNVRHYITSRNLQDSNSFPVSNTVTYGPIAAPPVDGPKDFPKFPNNIAFVQGNYVLERDELLDLQKEDYDVIMALSLTKWIHLNFGDDGLKRMFKRIYRQLRPGGCLILEPQPWSSYKKKKKLTSTIHQNFQTICLKPVQFSDYLLSKEVGFSKCEVVDVPYNKSKGFRRPIQLFRKAETAANSPKQGSLECSSALVESNSDAKKDTTDFVDPQNQCN